MQPIVRDNEKIVYTTRFKTADLSFNEGATLND